MFDKHVMHVKLADNLTH